ncbi:hypothetical protein BV22DRAFT_451311 [Leucogyrophana mollusca]|uniref:Uncharacterized protein n=1 Tax=Leucogyrophana mollusca TaxID=85980 RepID=A0ACB8BL27_9AGAM|nr:hypothetical protein BV22DRAFT_451311 [Leucogyrophana mollusca]
MGSISRQENNSLPRMLEAPSVVSIHDPSPMKADLLTLGLGVFLSTGAVQMACAMMTSTKVQSCSLPACYSDALGCRLARTIVKTTYWEGNEGKIFAGCEPSAHSSVSTLCSHTSEDQRGLRWSLTPYDKLQARDSYSRTWLGSEGGAIVVSNSTNPARYGEETFQKLARKVNH